MPDICPAHVKKKKVFGLYCINDPENLWKIIDEQLGNDIKDGKTGDFSFTACLIKLMALSGMRGMIVDGRRVDLGVASCIPHIQHMPSS